MTWPQAVGDGETLGKGDSHPILPDIEQISATQGWFVAGMSWGLAGWGQP